LTPGIATWAASFLPQPVENAVLRCALPVLACTTGIPAALLQGTTRISGCKLRLLIAGRKPWVYHLPKQLFSACAQESLPSIPIWRLERTLQRYRTSADVVLILADRISAALFLRGSYLTAPEWLGTRLKIPEDPDSLPRANRSIEQDMRLMKRSRLAVEVSHDESDFDSFYDLFYAPFIHERHGVFTCPMNRYSLARCMRRGGILWTIQDGRRIAAALFERRGQVFRFCAVGSLGGDYRFVKEGAISALYFHSIKYAHQRGWQYADFGGFRSSLEDGLVRYKRKWGVAVTENRHCRSDYFVGWSEWTLAVATFLSETSMVCRTRQGLSAFTAIVSDQPATQADADRAYHRLWIGGLQNLSIVSGSGWENGLVPPPQTSLLTPDGIPRLT
jgi:hypothetical protein